MEFVDKISHLGCWLIGLMKIGWFLDVSTILDCMLPDDFSHLSDACFGESHLPLGEVLGQKSIDWEILLIEIAEVINVLTTHNGMNPARSYQSKSHNFHSETHIQSHPHQIGRSSNDELPV